MNLADKPCYPFSAYDNFSMGGEPITGLTFRERLIIALAGNPNECYHHGNMSAEKTAYNIIAQADAIIKKLESEEV